jgi:hypothetical protein
MTDYSHTSKHSPGETASKIAGPHAVTLIDNRTPVQRKSNNTGLPDNLKSGIENLSGHSMDDVKVHYNSSQPAQLNAHAYAQGTNIHLAPGQEKHLAHEAWHVVQQKQGRVRPTVQMKGKVNINDDAGLEKEADVMGAKAIQRQITEQQHYKKTTGGNNTAQLSVHKYDGTLTIGMQQRFDEAYNKFIAQVVTASPLAQGSNQVAIYGASKKDFKKWEDYGVTHFYVGTNGYTGDDPSQFTEVWNTTVKNPPPHTVSLRVVMTVNMSVNSTIEELYATMLHEWFIHAVKWEPLVKYIRNPKGPDILAQVLSQGHVARGDEEHKEYANMSDDELLNMAKTLGLPKDIETKIAEKLINDHKRHDPLTGKAK